MPHSNPEAAARPPTTPATLRPRDFYLTLFENFPALVWRAGLDGHRDYFNDTWLAFTGQPLDQALGAGWVDGVHPEDRDACRTTYRAAFDRREPFEMNYRLRRHDGEYRWLRDVGRPIQDLEGKFAGYLGSGYDTTEHRQLVEALQQGQKLESVGRLAAGIAHEINTPTQFIGDNIQFVRDAFKDLQAVLTQCQRLHQAARAGTIPAEVLAGVDAACQKADLEYLAAEVPKAIEQTLEGVNRVSKIVRAMKDFSHPGSEDKTPCDLNRAIESTLTVCRNEWKYVAELQTQYEPNLPTVTCRVGGLNQVVLNLVINAAHAIADVVGRSESRKGKITIATRHQDGWAEIRIRDTGSGIPEAVRPKIFDPFFTTKGVGKGTGQGLAIARSVVVDQHGGTLGFETKMGQGTCFIIRIPVGLPGPPPANGQA